MFDAWKNEGFGCIIELIESQYINISTYKPLLGSSFMNLPIELRNPRKGLINPKNEELKESSKIAKKLDYDGIEFSVK